MKKLIRIISGLLTAITLIGGLSVMPVMEVSAAEKTEADKIEETLEKYLTTEYKTPEEKLATMQLRLEKDGYQLWVDELSGETATVNLASGQILFSNPYDIATTKGSQSTKEQIMSQLVVKYVDNDQDKYFYSFVEASYRGQVKVKNIKGGIRVEYTIGREETRMLVPRYIRKERFEEKILAPVLEVLTEDQFEFKKLKAYYLLKDPNEISSDRGKTELYAAFPITKKMAIYVFDPVASETEIRKVEELIKTYCPLYTYEELDKDHEETEYEGSDRAPALFKMALEYTLDEQGMSVRLPANGIRFDESEYKLTYISMLPYIGAGANYAGDDQKNVQTGYTFYPDGSGSIFRFEELSSKGTTTISGKVYGQDFAYHTITGAHQETIRYPAFGIVSNDKITYSVDTQKEDGTTVTVAEEKEISRGYAAVIEEGDALAEIYTYHAGSLSKYNTLQMMFYPRPKDSYNMADAISVGTNSTWTVVSKRKYVGNYKIRYFMLTDDEIAAEKGMDKYYETSWLGMAVAYREYLDNLGVLERMQQSEIDEDIPLYIETFGAIDTIKKILSVPVNTQVALTSFEDIITMYDELSAEGIDNIHFKLTGYANGGMYSTMPYNLDWEKAVGGKNGFEELVAYATEKDFGVYPDFDFVYAQSFGNFDGLNNKKHLVKTIDNRYTSRREYSATYQTFVSYFQMAISPAYYAHFYEKFSSKYLKYGYGNISLGNLGSDLNSDFDEDEPYNREDSKQFTINALEYFDNNYDSIMVTGGNAYTWKYVDHILGVSLDSSRYNRSSNSVPFIGVLLHGYINFAGSALNMEGNIGYAKLRTIENGASPYFILSYNKDNATLLKDDSYLSKYYSVRYDIWQDELIDIYNELNAQLADVQTKLIISHEFLVGERVPDADELEADIIAAEQELKAALEKAEQTATAQAIKDILTARQTTKDNDAKIATLMETAQKASEDAKKSIADIDAALASVSEAQKTYDDAVAAEAELKAVYDAAKQAATDAKAAATEAAKGTDQAAIEAANKAKDEATAAESAAKTEHSAAQSATKTANTALTNAKKALETAIKAGITAHDTAVSASAQVVTLAEASRIAADFIATVESATEAIKAAAEEYAVNSEKNAASTVDFANSAIASSSVAIAINAQTTINSYITTAQKANTTAVTRAASVKSSFDNAVTAEKNSEEAKVARDEALKVYEDAKVAYEEATAKAALDTATATDRKAATDAGKAMNLAKEEYEKASATATRLENTFNSSKTALKNALQKVLDEQAKVEKAADDIVVALEDAKNAVDKLKTLDGISDAIMAAAEESYANAVELAKAIDSAVADAAKTYNDSAEIAKGYVVIIDEPEVEEEPVETPAETPSTDENTEDIPDDGENTETEDEGDNADLGNQLYADYEYTKYTNDNGNIVKVTYGDQDASGKYVAYKTFILNYNFFAVTVVLDGVTYTIPASGYVVFYH